MNTDYEIVIYREEDYWVAECPELIGCATHGDTRTEAFEKINELLPIWLQSARESKFPFPEPKARAAVA